MPVFIVFLSFIIELTFADLCLADSTGTEYFPGSLTERTGLSSCWARYSTYSIRSTRTSLCVSQTEWLQWIHQAFPQPLRIPEINAWRTYSPLHFKIAPQNTKQVFIEQRLSLNYAHPVSQESHSTFKVLFLRLIQGIEKIREQGSEFLKPHDPMGILRSLVFHEGVQREPLPMLRHLGFVHLITTTGIHLYSLREWLNWILKKLFQITGVSVAHGLIVRRLIIILSCSTLWLLNGARLGMLRPWSIILIQDLARFLGLKWKRGIPLVFIVSLELIWQLWAYLLHHRPFSWGAFFYSMAVGGGLYFLRAYSSQHLGLAVGSWILLAIWEAWEDHLISFATPLLSLITIPMVCTFTYPCILICYLMHALGFETFSNTILEILSHIFHVLIRLFTWLSLLPGNLWVISHRSLIFGSIFSVLLLWMRGNFRGLKTQIQYHLIALCTLIGLRYGLMSYKLLHNDSKLASKEAREVIQLDVGQGDAAIVFHREKTGLIDSASPFSLKDIDWLKIFASHGIRSIDWIAITHLDSDHSGGVHRIARLIPIHCIGVPHFQLDSDKGSRFLKHADQHHLKITDFSSACIPFPTKVVSSQKVAANSHMGTIFIPLSDGGSYLGTGDLNAEDESEVGKWANELTSLRPGVRRLKVSHHGSKTATTAIFLKDYSPHEAWISVGHRNVYHHPHPSVLQRLKSINIKIRRTDQEGSLSTSHPKTSTL